MIFSLGRGEGIMIADYSRVERKNVMEMQIWR